MSWIVQKMKFWYLYEKISQKELVIIALSFKQFIIVRLMFLMKINKKLIQFMGKHHSYDFVENATTQEGKQGIFRFYDSIIRGEGKKIQAKKWYNNILKHLKI